jgi:hypothetical protein
MLYLVTTHSFWRDITRHVIMIGDDIARGEVKLVHNKRVFVERQNNLVCPKCYFSNSFIPSITTCALCHAPLIRKEEYQSFYAASQRSIVVAEVTLPGHTTPFNVCSTHLDFRSGILLFLRFIIGS